jgi:hypothetical protein
MAAALGVAAQPPEVSVEGLEVRILAEASPLDELLAALSEATGMEVVYEAAPPSVNVTAELRALTHAEAVIRLLDGLAVSYALQQDASGERVTRLWIAGHAPGKGSRPRVAPGPAPPQPQSPPFPAPVAVEDEQGRPPAPRGGGESAVPATSPGPVVIPRAFPTPLVMPTPAPPAATSTPAEPRG